MKASFEWDEEKNKENQKKHDVSFEKAMQVFRDTRRLIYLDTKHSTEEEKRFFCIGRIEGGIVTVRFTPREGFIRIIGAGFWRKYRKLYLVSD